MGSDDGLASVDPGWPPAQVLVEITAVGSGVMRGGASYDGSRIGSRLRYSGHSVSADGNAISLHQADAATGLTVTSLIESLPGSLSLRSHTRVSNLGGSDIRITAVSSLAMGFDLDIDNARAIIGKSGWTSEGRWVMEPLRSAGLVDYGQSLHAKGSPPYLRVGSSDSWSTGQFHTTGGVDAGNYTMLWQIEHNGAWQYQLTERPGDIGLALFGPTDLESHWAPVLAPGDSLETVPVGVVVAAGGLDAAASELTRYRRSLRRGRREVAPIVFNDYMNTLNGDPTTEKLLPLVAAAAAAGAEFFCIDAGWYDADSTWWDSVGEWQPSPTRFPGGLGRVTNRISAAGMTPGLWLEPEVIGIRSPLADTLPSDAFLTRGGVRVEQNGRYLLDFRNPAVSSHLDGVVDRLVRDFGIGFFKLDYNTTTGAGSDSGGVSAGEGLLAHNRALLTWIDNLRARHPQIVIENCASGALRMDYAMLSRMDLQSTSDQQDPLRYAAIAAAAPMSMTPEQAANWAYPQPGMSAERATFCLANGMLGAMYLSGYLNRMTAEEFALVADAVKTHRSLRAEIAASVPSWPMGLPEWGAPHLALGLSAGRSTLLTLWDRSTGASRFEVPLPAMTGRPVRVERVYPSSDQAWGYSWDAATGVLSVNAPGAEAAARVIRVVPDDAVRA